MAELDDPQRSGPRTYARSHLPTEPTITISADPSCTCRNALVGLVGITSAERLIWLGRLAGWDGVGALLRVGPDHYAEDDPECDVDEQRRCLENVFDPNYGWSHDHKEPPTERDNHRKRNEAEDTMRSAHQRTGQPLQSRDHACSHDLSAYGADHTTMKHRTPTCLFLVLAHLVKCSLSAQSL